MLFQGPQKPETGFRVVLGRKAAVLRHVETDRGARLVRFRKRPHAVGDVFALEEVDPRIRAFEIARQSAACRRNAEFADEDPCVAA